MEDRRPQNPGRVKITPESGEPYFAKMEMADNPLSEGTPLNTETLLTDETADKIGLTVKTPNKAFSKLWDEVRKITVGVIVPKSIRVKTPPRKTSYLPGDSFDPAGMVIEVTYSNDAKLDATGFTWNPDGELSEGTSSVTITYTEYGKTLTTSQSISVVRGVISVPTVSGSLTYNGSRQSPAWSGYDSSKMTINGNTSEIDAGTYTATFTPSSRYKWPDGSTGAKSVSWAIGKASANLSVNPTSINLSGEVKTSTVKVSRNGNGTISASSNTSAVQVSLDQSTGTITVSAIRFDVSSATVSVSVATSKNHNSASTSFAVYVKALVAIQVPYQSGTLFYTGGYRYPSFANYDSSKMTMGGTTNAVNSGTYTATFTPKPLYKWSDGSTGTKSVNWNISRATGNVVLSPNSVELNPSHKSAAVSISRLGNGTISVSGGGGIVTTSLSGTTLTIRSKESGGNATVYVNVAQSQNYTSASASVSVTASFGASVSTSPKSGVSYSDGLNGLDPKQISEIAKAISDTPSITKDTQVVYADYGSIHRKLSAVASSQNLSIVLNGTGYIFDIIGFNHDTMTSSTAYGSSTATGKAGITLQMHDLWSEYKQMNSDYTNSGSWRASMMRKQTMPQMRGYMPSGWQNILKKVDKVTSIGDGAKSGLETTSDDLFLLAEGEIFGPGWGYAGKGYACDDEIPAAPQYAWYKAGNSKVKKKSGPADEWWERSPRSGNTTNFCRVNSKGNADSNYASVSRCVAFGFCV